MKIDYSAGSYGLVLAGGGAKGAYQIGAWRAMREMNVSFSAVSGVSIGAINGAMIIAGDYEKTMKLWKNVRVDENVKIDSELKDPGNLFSTKNYPVLLREILKNGGIDASPTKEYLKAYIDEKKVREADIPYTFVTYQLSALKPLELDIEEIPEGELIDYILASAKFPGVSNIGPDGEWYIDGGAYDNAPVSILRKKGINRLIVIDISSIKGLAHQDDFTCAEVIYIRPYDIDELGASFDFEEEMTEKRMTLGYLDAMKAFGRLSGNVFHFMPDVFKSFIAHYGCDTVYELETFAYKLGLERIKIYSEEEFLSSLKSLYLKEKEQEEDDENEPRSLLEKLKRSIKTQLMYLKKDYELAVSVIEKLP